MKQKLQSIVRMIRPNLWKLVKEPTALHEPIFHFKKAKWKWFSLPKFVSFKKVQEMSAGLPYFTHVDCTRGIFRTKHEAQRGKRQANKPIWSSHAEHNEKAKYWHQYKHQCRPSSKCIREKPTHKTTKQCSNRYYTRFVSIRSNGIKRFSLNSKIQLK